MPARCGRYALYGSCILISVTFIRTIVSYLGGYTLGLGIVGIWFGVLADQMSRFIFATIRFKQGKWVKIKI